MGPASDEAGERGRAAQRVGAGPGSLDNRQQDKGVQGSNEDWRPPGTLMRRLAREPSGATAIEYGLIVAGIALAIVVVVFLVGDDIVELFESIAKQFQCDPERPGGGWGWGRCK